MAQDLYEEDDADGTPDAAAEESLPAAGDVAPAPAAPGAAPLHPMVQDLLNQRMAQLKAAQDQAKTNQSNVGIGQALAQLAHGISGAQGPADTSAFSAMEKNANAPVNNLVQQQNVETKAVADIKSQQGQDPNSPQAQALRNLYKSLYAKYGIDSSGLDGMGTDAIHTDAEKPLIAAGRLAGAEAVKSAAAQTRATAQETRDGEKQQKYIEHVEDAERGWRSDPASMRFDQNLAAASTADAIMSKYRGREDEMPMQDIHALVADKLKAMTGGTPTEAEIEAQIPHTGKTAVSSVKSYITGSPEPANAGDFVRSIDGYFKDIEAKSLAGLQNRQQTVASDPKISATDRARLVKIGVPLPVYPQNGGAQQPGQAPSDDGTGQAAAVPPGMKLQRNKVTGATRLVPIGG